MTILFFIIIWKLLIKHYEVRVQNLLTSSYCRLLLIIVALQFIIKVLVRWYGLQIGKGSSCFIFARVNNGFFY